MELLHLRYFREVAATENITKAARQLYVSQPALSTSITRLEKELGFLLFERKGNRIVLTEAGHCFLGYVHSVFSVLEEGIAKARQISDRSSKRLKIAAGFGVVRGMLEDYRKSHPDYEVELKFCDTDKMQQMLGSGKADVGLL